VPRGEEDEVGVAMDGEDGHYPRTINEELVELGQLLDDVDDMGDVVALLFGSNAALLFGSIGLLLKRYWSSLNCSMIQLLFFLVFITVRKMDPWPIYFGFWCFMTNTTKLD